MVTKEFSEACAEINEILKYLPTEYIEKIPIKLRKFLKEIEDKNYNSNINPYATLDKQDIKAKTKTLLVIIYRNYWCTEEERANVDKILIENDKKHEEILREKYDPNNIFKNNKINCAEEQINLPIQIKQENFFRRLINYIKKIICKG